VFKPYNNNNNNNNNKAERVQSRKRAQLFEVMMCHELRVVLGPKEVKYMGIKHDQ